MTNIKQIRVFWR